MLAVMALKERPAGVNMHVWSVPLFTSTAQYSLCDFYSFNMRMHSACMHGPARSGSPVLLYHQYSLLIELFRAVTQILCT